MTKVAKLAAFMIILILAFVKLAPFKMSKETTSLRFKHMPLLSIYIHSGPSLIEGRQRQRKHCFHSYSYIHALLLNSRIISGESELYQFLI